MTDREFIQSLKNQIDDYLNSDDSGNSPLTTPTLSYTFVNHRIKYFGNSEGKTVKLTIYPKEDN